MRDGLRKRGRAWAAVGALALAANAGCLTCSSAYVPLPPQCVERCEAVDGSCRGKVYVFLLSGFDPLDLDDVARVRGTLIRQGFIKVYDGQFYHAVTFAKEMRTIRTEVPDARFAVVGFGAGVEQAVWLARAAEKDNIPVELLASVDAPPWSSAPGQRPANVREVLHVHGRPWLFAGPAAAGEDFELPVSAPFAVPAHPLTLERLTDGLAAIAADIPTVRSVPSSMPVLPDDAPPPRPQAARPKGPRDAWDFLKPVSRLKDVAAPAAEPAPERTALR